MGEVATIAELSSFNNSTGKSDPEMHRTKEGIMWQASINAHVGADADSGLAPVSVRIDANVKKLTQAHPLGRGKRPIGYGGPAITSKLGVRRSRKQR